MNTKISAEQLLKEFSEKYPIISFEKDSVLVQAGETPKEIYFITAGKVQQIDIAPNGDEVTINIFAPPAFLSVSWLFEEVENRFNYRAVTEVEVRRVPLSDMQEFMRNSPEVSYATLGRLVRGLDGFMQRMSYQMFGSAEKKTAIELLLEAKRFHKHESGNIVLESNVTDITARTGLARETVSRQIAKLLEKGLIKKNATAIVIVSIGELESYIVS